MLASCMHDIHSLRALCICVHMNYCVCVCMRVRICVHVCANVCACIRVYILRCILSSWSSKGALANLMDTTKARHIEEAVAKCDWSTARDLLGKVWSGKQRCPSCHTCFYR